MFWHRLWILIIYYYSYGFEDKEYEFPGLNWLVYMYSLFSFNIALDSCILIFLDEFATHYQNHDVGKFLVYLQNDCFDYM